MISAELFVKSKEYFPIVIQSGSDIIQLDRRLKVSTADIFDIRINGIHQGMICGVYKDSKQKLLNFGQIGINKAFLFRNILEYSLVRLFQYFGLDNVDFIVIDAPEQIDVVNFLEKLGFEFIKQKKKYVLDLKSKGLDIFLQKMFEIGFEVLDVKGQIENLLKNIYPENPNEAVRRSKLIIAKIKEMNPLEQVYWDLKSVHEINTLVSSAVLYPNKIIQNEFVESVIKLTISSFENHLKEAYFEEIMATLEGKTQFSIEYFNRVLQHIKKIAPNGVKHAIEKKAHLKEWIEKNLPIWEKTSENKKQFEAKKKIETKLSLSDFGDNLPGSLAQFVQSLIDHYNGELIFFGLYRKI